MGTAPFRVQDIKSFLPSIEPTRSDEQFVLNGKDYIFDSLGPKSAFGNRLLLPQQITNPAHIQGVRLKLRSGDTAFTFTSQGIWQWSEALGGWRLIFRTTDTSVTPYRWTWGYLGGIMYFNHPLTGIIFYNIDENLCAKLEGPGVPTEVLAICVNNGRVVAMGPEFLYWSNPSNGGDWRPGLGGAGFQKINARVSGYPIMVTPYAQGVLTWTTGGVMRSQFTGDVEVFRHRGLNTEYRPINSFCTVQLDNDTILILDERGFYSTKGEAPAPFTEIFNEFLINFLQENQINLGTNIRLEWDELRKLLFVSYSMSEYDPIFESAFVLYPPLDKWGQFDTPHYGIFPLRIESSERADDYYGFVGADKRVRYWTNTGSREVMPTDTSLELYYPRIQKTFEQEAGGAFFTVSSTATVSTFPTEGRVVAGFYPTDGSAVEEPVLQGLDAWIQIGFFRGGEGIGFDELTEISQVLVRSAQSGDATRVSTNFNLSPPVTPDMNYSDPSTEDSLYGFGETNYVNHKLTIVSTLDGVNEFQRSEPELIQFLRGARYFTCSTVGMWHIVEIRATDVGEAFHVKTLEFTVAPAGRFT